MKAHHPSALIHFLKSYICLSRYPLVSLNFRESQMAQYRALNGEVVPSAARGSPGRPLEIFQSDRGWIMENNGWWAKLGGTVTDGQLTSSSVGAVAVAENSIRISYI